MILKDTLNYAAENDIVVAHHIFGGSKEPQIWGDFSKDNAIVNVLSLIEPHAEHFYMKTLKLTQQTLLKQEN